MNLRTRTDVLLLAALCGFLFFYGLGSFGLVGADEPRYAQVSREMLARSDWVTPTLMEKPWLEKPVLYYWQAMAAFRVAGVTDKAARLPGALDAALLVAAIYFFLRRYRKGSELDGALITASCVGVIGFAHAAATDMPLAACFSIALLAWYAWYESQRRIYLAVFYVFLALGTLAKGPVAPALAAVIIVLFFIVRFIAIRLDWRGFWGTLWVPGIILYLAVALPWYVAVQLRNPEFFRVFILEHNLARFSQDVYHHRQPFWFYVPVFLLAMMPWTLVLILAVAERVRVLWAEGKQRFSRPEDSCSENSCSENSWSLFLLIWMVVPVLFFSASQSKLPGYILPAVPAGALLVAEYLDARRRASGKLSLGIVAGHAMLCGVLIFAAVSAASMAMNHRLVWGQGTWVAAAMGGGLALGIGAALLSAGGLRLLSRVTLFAVVVSVAAVVRFAAPVIDDTRSARPIAESIEAFSHEPVPVAIYRVKRGQEYGLEFYLNRRAEKYEDGNIPAAEHVLVAAQGSQPQVAELVPGRRVSYLTSIPEQKLELYWVGK
ncbi:MAG TPA: glycosyltransferase family 39 protein [Terriglobales bacterium]|nr:glycosyltransferase family 39 protein [Terriglobales bacterium]